MSGPAVPSNIFKLGFQSGEALKTRRSLAFPIKALMALGVAYLFVLNAHFPSTAQKAGNAEQLPANGSGNGQAATNMGIVGSETPEANALEWFKATVPLIQTLVWPAAILILATAFRSHIANVVSSRMQSGKVKALGVELEIEYIKDTDHFEAITMAKTGDKPAIYGNPDMFQLLAKATSASLMKSTKVMNTPNGCVVQVSTKELGPKGSLGVAEAVTFVPGMNVVITRDHDNNLTKTDFVEVSANRTRS